MCKVKNLELWRKVIRVTQVRDYGGLGQGNTSRSGGNVHKFKRDLGKGNDSI